MESGYPAEDARGASKNCPPVPIRAFPPIYSLPCWRRSRLEELCRMGADIRIEGEKAVIQGVPRLYGTDLTARELRGGAALVLAAAAAEGTSRIYQYHYIARGYENIIRDLQSLGVLLKSRF